MRFSQIEREHLLKAWIAISLAFTILFANVLSSTFIIFFIISLLTVGVGFLFHEIAHKAVAQKYGCWAEFRADDKMLMIAIFSAFLGFVFAAPGAVLIHGYVTREKNGKISLAGPLTNIILALVFLLAFLFIPLAGFLSLGLRYGYRINTFIALFNLIPMLNFDGTKIYIWNKKIYFATVVSCLILLLLPVS